jgi:hypothetical protein
MIGRRQAAATAAILLLVLGLGPEASARGDAPAPPSVATRGEPPVVKLGPSAQTALGTRIARLEASKHQVEQQAYGKVLSLQGLADLGRSYARAQAGTRSAVVQEGVAREQYLRLKQLSASQNASTRALQAAQGAYEVAAAATQAAKASERALEGVAQQEWGNVVLQWLVTGSPAYADLINGRQVLVQITLPVGAHLASAPTTVLVHSPSGAAPVRATFVSPAPRTDPRIQGMSYFYQAPAKGTELLPGMTVAADVPIGPPLGGVTIPSGALIWWQGRPWAYEQVAPDAFVRREVPTDIPLEEGYFAASGFSAGVAVVVQGAAELLALEIRPPAPQDTD